MRWNSKDVFESICLCIWMTWAGRTVCKYRSGSEALHSWGQGSMHRIRGATHPRTKEHHFDLHVSATCACAVLFLVCFRHPIKQCLCETLFVPVMMESFPPSWGLTGCEREEETGGKGVQRLSWTCLDNRLFDETYCSVHVNQGSKAGGCWAASRL